MDKNAKELGELVEVFKNEFANLDESLTSVRISDDKWTLKEIIGHLIDSASNNHQRFIRMKLSDEIEFPDYKNGEWLSAHNYNSMKFSDLLSLFYFYNKLIANIILTINEEELNNRWKVKWDENSSYITLERLSEHYVEHLKFHLGHFRDRLSEIKIEG